MKVVCVNAKTESYTLNGVNTTMPPVYIGNFYTVVDVKKYFIKNKAWVMYELAEVPPDPMRFYYASVLFADCSGIDESELVNTKEEMYV